MATVLYGTMLTTPAAVETVQRYLYDHTEVIEAAPIVEFADEGARQTGRLVFLILRTEADTPERTAFLQQYQCDRLASGMHGMTIGFESRSAARQHAEGRALDNDWGLVPFGPFVLSAVGV